MTRGNTTRVIFFKNGAGGSRTHTLSRAEDFKSPASANSATAPVHNCSALVKGVKGVSIITNDPTTIGLRAIIPSGEVTSNAQRVK